MDFVFKYVLNCEYVSMILGISVNDQIAVMSHFKIIIVIFLDSSSEESNLNSAVRTWLYETNDKPSCTWQEGEIEWHSFREQWKYTLKKVKHMKRKFI